ncbi:hypothetical protein FHG87_020898 [Trinorchestia longiramus]|nr:hypothetical protein FHG87_020898 [Trinorchestia longiramus]
MREKRTHQQSINHHAIHSWQINFYLLYALNQSLINKLEMSLYIHPKLNAYRHIGEEALCVILPFSSTYLCETGFSALVVLKIKQRNRLDVENDLRCALSSFNPRISDLVRKKQQHPSH